MIETTNKPPRDYIRLILIGALIVLAALLLKTCAESNKKDSLYQQNLRAEQDKVKYYTNELGTQTASKLAFQKTNEQLKQELKYAKENGTKAQRDLAILADKFRTITSIGTAEGRFKIDTIPFPFADTIPCQFKPKRFTAGTDYYSANLYVDNKQALITDLNVVATQHIIFGYKAKGLFKNDEAVMEITFDNPHIEITNATGTIGIIETPWYKKWWIWFLAGVGVGGAVLSL